MVFNDIQAQYQRYKSQIDQRISQVLEHSQFIQGPEVLELEGALSSFVGCRHCITVASGTDSLEIALRAMGIGPGDEVITVPFTWISTAEVISLVGARPVFVDIDPKTYNIAPSAVKAAVTSRTKAIIAVSLFGQMADIKELESISNRHGLALIEDGAQSFGATQSGIRSCGASLVGSTSFFPAKPFGCFGDGGALFTSDDALADRMRAIRNHGGLVRHHHTVLGMNGRFDTLQAAILLAKLPHFENELKCRADSAAFYDDSLKDFCEIPFRAPENTHVYAQYTIRAPNRDRLLAHLSKSQIPVAVYYPKCLHEQPVFEDLGYKYGQFPVAENASREVLSLPMHAFLNEADQRMVVEAVKSGLAA